MMQGSLLRTYTDSATQQFEQRCHELGLAVYRRSGEHDLLCSISGETPIALWLGRASLKEAIAQCLLDPPTPSVAIEPGVFLLNIDDTMGTGDRLGVLTLSEEACTDPGFATRCKAAGLDSDVLCEAFEATPRHPADQHDTLTKTLTWNLADLRRVDQSNFAAEDLTEQLGQNYENITLLYRLGRSLSTLESPQQVAQSVCTQLLETQEFGWVSAFFRSGNTGVPELSGKCLVAGDLPGDRATFETLLEQLTKDWYEDQWSKLLQVGEHPLADHAQSEIVIDPIQHDGRVIGAVLAGGKTGVDPEATSSDTQLVDAIASYLGTFHENAARFNEQQMMFIGTLEAVSTALDAKDPYTYGHSDRVAHLGMELARAIGLKEPEVERIRIAGLVHDVGKIGVPEAVLCKTGRLTDEEYEQIKLHPRIGYNILKGIPKMEDVLDGVLYHHERWDGRGYPERKAGEDIPLYGRILAVADTFDAMSSTRSYRHAMPREKVLAEILRCSGSQFDPSLTGPFVKLDFTRFDELVQYHEGLANKAA
ncbi:MAG: HD-GYP domain-containing protein [Phycisphaerales bacterium JB063]